MDCNTCAPLCMPEDHMSMFMGYCVKDHFWKTTNDKNRRKCLVRMIQGIRTWLKLVKLLLTDDAEFHIPYGEPNCFPESHFEWIWKEHCGVALFRKSAAGLLSGWFVAKLLTKPSRFTCKKKTWPIIMGLGMGLGLASEYCKREFGHALSDKRKRRRRHRKKQHLNWSEPCK